MTSDNSYESFLRERWFGVSQDAARAEALLELLIEQESPDCRIPRHLRNSIEKFLAGRKERRKAAQARLDAMELEKAREEQTNAHVNMEMEKAREEQG